MSDEVRVLTLEQFAKERGLTTTADVDSHIHAGLASKPQTKTYDRWNSRRLAELQNARDETARLYRAEIASGRIREMTSRERLEATALGHDDNHSVQAARRTLARMAARRAHGTLPMTPLIPAQKRALDWLPSNGMAFFPSDHEEALNELCKGAKPLVERRGPIETMLGARKYRYNLTVTGIALKAEMEADRG